MEAHLAGPNTIGDLVASGRYNYIDFGASNGGSLKFAATAFGGRGFGVDIDPMKIVKLRSSGLEGIVADATSLELDDDAVDYVTMMHFLEHLPNRRLGEAMIASAVRVARRFVFIVGPDFEDGEYLKEHGFKKYYADWRGHQWHHLAREFASICAKHQQCRTFILQTGPFHDSYDRTIHPVESPGDQGPYDAEKHPPKRFMKFDRKIFSAIMVLIIKDERISPGDLLLRSNTATLLKGRDLLQPLVS